MDAEIQQLILLVVVGGVAGWLAAQIVGAGSFGILWNVIVGIAGAYVAGKFLPDFFAIGGIGGQIANATVGALVLLILIWFVRRLLR